jgi:hypothetical protein
MAVTPLGIVKVGMIQAQKTYAPKLRTLLGMFIEDRIMQASKAWAPMLVTLPRKLTVVKAWQ